MYLTIDVIDDEARRYDHGEEGDLEIELGIDIHRVESRTSRMTPMIKETRAIPKHTTAAMMPGAISWLLKLSSGARSCEVDVILLYLSQNSNHKQNGYLIGLLLLLALE